MSFFSMTRGSLVLLRRRAAWGMVLLALACGPDEQSSETPDDKAVSTRAQALGIDQNVVSTGFKVLRSVGASTLLAERSAGFRIVDLDVVGISGGSPVFNAVLVNAGSLQRNWDLVTGLTFAQVQQRNWGTHIPDLLKPFAVNGTTRYAVVSVEVAGGTWRVSENTTTGTVVANQSSFGLGIADVEPMPLNSGNFAALYTNQQPALTLLLHTHPDGILTWLDDNPGQRLVKWRRTPVGFLAAARNDGSGKRQYEYHTISFDRAAHLWGRHGARPLDIAYSGNLVDVILVDNGLPATTSNAGIGGAATSFDTRIRDFMRRSGIPGMGLAILNRGRLVYAAGYGISAIAVPGGNAEERATPRTMFRIASMSKTVAAIAFLKLMQSNPATPVGGGTLNLGTRIFRDVLQPRLGNPPGAPYNTALNDVTAEQVLTHTAGFSESFNPLSNNTVVARDLGIQRTPTCSETVRWLMNRSLARAPGTGYEYYNAGPCIIAAVIEAITGEGYESFINRRLFAPIYADSGIVHSSDLLGVVPSCTALPACATRKAGEAIYYSSVSDYIEGFELKTPKLLELAPSWSGGLPNFGNIVTPVPYGGIPLRAAAPSGGLAASPVAFARLLTAVDGSSPTQILTPVAGVTMVNGSDANPGSPQNNGYGLFTQVNPANGDVFHSGTTSGGFGWWVMRTPDQTGWVVTANMSEHSNCAARAFNSENLTGTGICLESGDHDQAALAAKGIANDTISSLKVVQGMRVELFRDHAFSGPSLVRTESDPRLANHAFDNQASSIRITPHALSGELNNLMLAAYGETRAQIMNATGDLFGSFGMVTSTNFDSGFEQQSTDIVLGPWAFQGSAGIDRRRTAERTGTNNAWVRSTSGWNKVFQNVFVQPNRSYRLGVWVQSSGNNTDGYVGARLINGGAILSERKFTSLPGYTQFIIDFNSGSNNIIEIFGGIWGHAGDPWARFDDMMLFPL